MNANYFTMAKREFCTKQETKTCHKGSWVRWSDFSSETDGQKAVDFKEKTYLLIKNSISCKTVLNSEGETKTFLDKEKLKSSLPLSSLSYSVMSYSLRPHGLQHARLPCSSPTSGACSNSCPLSQWCHPTISSFVIPFSPCLQSFPASGPFPMSQSFASGGQSIGVSASASVLPMNIQGWFPLGWTGWISLQSKGLSRIFSSTTVQKHQLSLQSNSHIHTWLLEKP